MHLIVPTYKRTKTSKKKLMLEALTNPLLIQRELNNRYFYEFFKYFWEVISSETLIDNWHIKYLCDELQLIQERVSAGKPKLYDLIINIPPGTSKTSIVSIMFPVWCWTRDITTKFITASYSSDLSLESAEAARDVIRSSKFRVMYPNIEIKPDKDTKSNYKVIKTEAVFKGTTPRVMQGGNRYSTSVGGTVTGFHGHILIVDDPLNPHAAASKQVLTSTNHWVDQVLSTRKVDKDITTTIMVMQRINQKDPSGHILAKKKGNVKHICLPGELGEYEKYVTPPELVKNYVEGLLDPVRLSRKALKELEADLGQYGYAGQIGQRPTPPGGGMFKVDNFMFIERMPMEHEIEKTVRYWDKAGTKDGGAYTTGVKICKLKIGKFLVVDVKRGQWSSDVRENIIKSVAEADGKGVHIYVEQEPGSGGKESAEATIKNLAGFSVERDLPRGDKVFRADPYSVQVNNGNVMLLKGDWNYDYIEEHRFFPFGQYKDQVDAGSAGFNKLTGKREAKTW